MQERFSTLRTISVLFKLLAWIVLVAGVIGALVVLLAPSPASEGEGIQRFLLFGVFLFFAFFYWLLFYAIAEVIGVVLAVEENTRRTAYEMANIARPPQTLSG